MDRKLTRRVFVGIATAAIAVATATIAVRAGHEMPVYPSYYPQEIRIEPMSPATAAEALARARIQAYVGGAPAFAGNPGATISSVQSLRAFLVVRVNPDSPAARDNAGRCKIAKAVIGAVAGDAAGFRLHPYPITPLHADYFHHADLAWAAAARHQGKADAFPGLKVAATGPLAEILARRHWPAQDWDARIDEIGLDALLAPHRIEINGWNGPPWLKEGWYHAYRLLADGLVDEAARTKAADGLRRLQQGDFAAPEEKINLERDLVGLLAGNCRLVVMGYAVRREFYSAEYSSGVENIAFDSLDGFNSAIFIRTVKLKDFPWNGWLTLGIDGEPRAAWNPVGGFTDPAGRLIWHALGDPGLFPEPYNAGWNMNRIGDVKRTPR